MALGKSFNHTPYTILGAHLRKPNGYKENSVKWKCTWSSRLGAWHVQLIRMVLWNARAGRGMKDDLILVSDFTGTVNGAQGEEVTCPRSHGKILVIQNLAP